MKITLSPVRMDAQLIASVSGDTIMLNGAVLDFTLLQDGETLPHGAIDSLWIPGDVQRIGGEIHITLRLPHGKNAPQETRFQAAFYEPMTVLDGEVPLPPYDLPESEPEFQSDVFITGGVRA